MDLIQAADPSKIDLLEFDPIPFPTANEDGKPVGPFCYLATPSFQELRISLLYRNENYSAILGYFDTLDLTSFSSKELFFASSAILKTNCTLPVRDRIESELIRRSLNPPFDSFCLYNLGLLWKLKHDSRCKSAFLSSVQQFPYFWSCWLELSALFLNNTENSVSSITPPIRCILKNFFQLYATNHLLQVLHCFSPCHVRSLKHPNSCSRPFPPSFPHPLSFESNLHNTNTIIRVGAYNILKSFL